MASSSSPAHLGATTESFGYSVHIPPRTPIAPELWDPIVNNQRDLRLTALKLDPTCFSSTHERETRFEQKDWEARLLNPLVYTFAAIQEDPLGSTPLPLYDANGFQRLASRPWIGNAVLCERQGRSATPTSAAHGDSTTFYIEGFYVLPSHRSRGVGGRLIQSCTDYAMSRAQEHGIQKVNVCVRVFRSNEKAIKFYEKQGFKPSVEERALEEITMFFEAGVSR